MPHVVSTYLTFRDDRVDAMKRARDVQKKLIEGYNNDFAKHYKINPKIYLPAIYSKQTHSMPLINLAGTYFWVRAPIYMPNTPPNPKSRPKCQSGVIDRSE